MNDKQVTDGNTDAGSQNAGAAQPLLRAKQKRGIWTTLIVIAVVVTLFMSMFMYKILSPRILSNEELQLNRAFVFDAPRIIKPFELIDQNQQAFTLEDLTGKWSLVYFGFTHCPDICPTTLAQMARLMAKLDADIAEQTQVILVSVDPARDTPEALSQYVSHFNPEFTGVTGEFLQIMQFTGNLNVAFNKVVLDDDYTVDHTGNLVLINPNGHYHGFFKPPFELSALKTTFQSIVSSY